MFLFHGTPRCSQARGDVPSSQMVLDLPPGLLSFGHTQHSLQGDVPQASTSDKGAPSPGTFRTERAASLRLSIPTWEAHYGGVLFRNEMKPIDLHFTFAHEQGSWSQWLTPNLEDSTREHDRGPGSTDSQSSLELSLPSSTMSIVWIMLSAFYHRPLSSRVQEAPLQNVSVKYNKKNFKKAMRFRSSNG